MADAGFASLSPTLLARKGAARPAMRPQVQPLQSEDLHGGEPGDDLGWNDMGDENSGVEDGGKAEVIAFTPPARRPAAKPRKRAHNAKPGASGKRAAFTLRIDPDRHLKLRLACTVTGRSAQQLITEALDRYLDGQAEVTAIAAGLGPAN